MSYKKLINEYISVISVLPRNESTINTRLSIYRNILMALFKLVSMKSEASRHATKLSQFIRILPEVNIVEYRDIILILDSLEDCNGIVNKDILRISLEEFQVMERRLVTLCMSLREEADQVIEVTGELDRLPIGDKVKMIEVMFEKGNKNQVQLSALESMPEVMSSNTITEDITKYKTEAEKVKEEKEILRKQYEELQRQLESKEEEVDIVRTNAIDKVNRLKEEVSSIDEIKKELDILKSKNEQLSEVVSNSNREKEESITKARELEESLVQLKNSLTSKDIDNQRLKEEIMKYRSFEGVTTATTPISDVVDNKPDSELFNEDDGITVKEDSISMDGLYHNDLTSSMSISDSEDESFNISQSDLMGARRELLDSEDDDWQE